jgi:hypothetical protein
MFPALKKKTILSSAPLASKLQFEPNLRNYSYAQAVKTPSLENVIKQNNT